MTWGEALFVILLGAAVGSVVGAVFGAVMGSFRRARAVIDGDRDAVLDTVFPPRRAEGEDIP